MSAVAISERDAEITRLRTFITALEDGNMTFLCDELDKAKAENVRLRSLVEEAGKVVERCQAVLAIMIKPDMTVSSMNAYTLCVEAEARSRSLLTKLKPEPQTLTGKAE